MSLFAKTLFAIILNYCSSPEASDALASILQDYPEIYAWLLCKDGERFRELIDNLAKQPNHSRVHNLLEHHLKGLHLLCCRHVKQEDHSQQIEWRMWGSGDHSESFSEELKIWAELESSINPRYLPGWIDWRTAVENFSDSLAIWCVLFWLYYYSYKDI